MVPAPGNFFRYAYNFPKKQWAHVCVLGKMKWPNDDAFLCYDQILSMTFFRTTTLTRHNRGYPLWLPDLKTANLSHARPTTLSSITTKRNLNVHPSTSLYYVSILTRLFLPNVKKFKKLAKFDLNLPRTHSIWRVLKIFLFLHLNIV